MARFEDYADEFRCIRMERRDGILQMSLHTEGGPLQWNLDVQAELARAFGEVGADRDNRIIILTGTGEEFAGPVTDPDETVFTKSGFELKPSSLDPVWWNAKRLITRLLDIDVPMIAVVNGPAKRHSELALLCDIVLAADDATFEDTAHFHLGGHVPGDGVNVIYTLLLGINRARYFMLTGQVLSAAEAKGLGLVAEVMPRGRLLPRAWELGRQLACKPDLLLRYTRMVLVHPLREILNEKMEFFLAAEAVALFGHAER